MAGKDVAVSFDEIIKADRERRKNEALANEIFGRGRKSAQGANEPKGRKLGIGPSLASRVGVTKASQRSNSSTPRPKPTIDESRVYDLFSTSSKLSKPPHTARENPMNRTTRNDRLLEAATVDSPRNGSFASANTNKNGGELNIRGSAGPYVVIGSNFAPGTTAADIESAMVPEGGQIERCRIISATPTVMAEMVFKDKDDADYVISTFNNKKADGRLLYIYMKAGSAQTPIPAPAPKSPVQTKAAPPPAIPTQPSYDREREQNDRRRRAEPEAQDGSFGFDNREDRMDVDMADGRERPRERPREAFRGWDGGRPRNDRRLYSDDLYSRDRFSRPRGRGYR